MTNPKNFLISETVYHGSEKTKIKEILEKGFLKRKYPDIGKLNTGKAERIGSLGYGTYAFVSDEFLAWMYARKLCVCPDVISFEINYTENDILDLSSSSKDLRVFREFIENRKVKALINKYKGYYKNGRYQKSLQGAVIELYYLSLKLSNKVSKIKIVKMATETELNSYYIKTDVPNGIECCIKDISIINNDGIKKVSVREH